ncbi:hypothetical protein ACO0QE_004261 [Hanseniaspora vineae]
MDEAVRDLSSLYRSRSKTWNVGSSSNNSDLPASPSRSNIQIEGAQDYLKSEASQLPKVPKSAKGKLRDSLVLSTSFVPTRSKLNGSSKSAKFQFTPVNPRTPMQPESRNFGHSTPSSELVSPRDTSRNTHLEVPKAYASPISTSTISFKPRRHTIHRSDIPETPSSQVRERRFSSSKGSNDKNNILPRNHEHTRTSFSTAQTPQTMQSLSSFNTPMSHVHDMPHLNRHSSSSEALKASKELSHLESELSKQRKSKHSGEKIKHNIEKEIPHGNYSSSHIENHSLKLKANTKIRASDKNIKKLESQISNLKSKIDTNLTPNGSVYDYSTDSHEDLQTVPDQILHERFQGLSLHTPFTAPRKTFANDEQVSLSSSTGYSSETQNEKSMSGDLQKQQSQRSAAFGESHRNKNSKSNHNNETWLVSSYLQSLNDAKSCASKDFLLSKANALVELLTLNPELKDELISAAFIPAIQNLLTSKESTIVAAGYRVFRHLITKQDFFHYWAKSKVEVFIILTLSKEGVLLEKEQAFKLIRLIMEIAQTMSLGIIQACISFLERSVEAKLHDVCTELLLEMCYICPRNIVKTNCNRMFETIILETSNFEISKVILQTLLDLMAHHETRKYYIDYFTIDFLLAPLTDFYNSKDLPPPTKLLQKCVVLLSMCFKQYSGLMIFANNDFQNLRELIGFFKVPMLIKYLVDLFLDALRIKALQSFEGQSSYQNGSSPFLTRPSKFDKEIMTINQYIALVVRVLLKCDFHNDLKVVIFDNHVDSANAAKCCYLLSEFYHLTLNYCGNQKILTNYKIPVAELNEHARQTVEDAGGVNPQMKMLLNVSQQAKMNYNLSKGRNTLDMNDVNTTSNIIEFANMMRQEDLEREVSDVVYKKLITETRVLLTKNYDLWNWNVILQLIKGPLTNRRRLEELNRNTKFVRRLLVFYRPLRMRFSSISASSKLASKIIYVGCEFFKMLTQSPEGMRIWEDDLKLLPQIATSLFKAMEGHERGKNIFSKKSLETTLCSGYFKMLGALTETENGVKLLEKWNIFTVIYRMFKPKNTLCETYLQLMLKELYLWKSNHAKLILTKALVSPNKKIKILATHLLGYHLGLMEAPVALPKNIDIRMRSFIGRKSGPKSDSSQISKRSTKFLIKLLVKQLYDLSSDVVALSDKILYLYCMSSEQNAKAGNLDSSDFLVDCLDSAFEQLIFIGSPLLLQFLTTKIGFNKLDELGYISIERANWMSFKNVEYVRNVEVVIQNELANFSDSAMKSNNEKSEHKTYLTFGPGTGKQLPLHFYNYLAQSESGIRQLTINGDFISFYNCIRHFSMSLKSASVFTHENIEKLKAALWCVGFIGSTRLGVSLLESHSLVEDILKLAYECPSISVKFTSFYVLGLISKSNEGSEMISQFSWDCCTNVQGTPVGICIPQRVDQFLKFPEINKGAVSLLEDHFNEEGAREANLEEYIKDSLVEGPSEYGNSVLDENHNPNSSTGHQKILEPLETSQSSLEYTTPMSQKVGFQKGEKYTELTNYVNPGEFEEKSLNIPETVGLGFKQKKPMIKIDEEDDFPQPDMNLDRLLYMSKVLEDPSILNDEEFELAQEVEKQALALKNYENRKSYQMRHAFTNGEDEFIDRVIYLVGQLNSHLTLVKTRKELTAMYKQEPQKFEIPEVANKVLELMASYKFTPEVRKFLCQIFLSAAAVEAMIRRERTKKKY